jgi:hypothetical protein
LERADFDKKVAENPLNEHLLQVVVEPTEKDPHDGLTQIERIREELSERGFAVSDELIGEALSIYSSHSGRGDFQDIADFIEDEYLTDEDDLENQLGSEGEPYTPQIGDRYEIQGRQFVVDSVDTTFETVSLKDATFQNGVGFPIFRREPFEFIRMYDPIREGQPGIEEWSEPSTADNAPDHPGEPSDDIDAYLPEQPLAPNQHVETIDGVEFVVTTPFSHQKQSEPSDASDKFRTLEAIEAEIDRKIELARDNPDYEKIKNAAGYWKNWRNMSNLNGVTSATTSIRRTMTSPTSTARPTTTAAATAIPPTTSAPTSWSKW